MPLRSNSRPILRVSPMAALAGPEPTLMRRTPSLANSATDGLPGPASMFKGPGISRTRAAMVSGSLTPGRRYEARGAFLSEGTSESVGGRETLQAWVAALVTVVLWASAFVGLRGRTCRRARCRWRVHLFPPGAVFGSARPARYRFVRGALVRTLQRRAQRRRAAGGRRYGLHACRRWPRPHRGVRRRLVARGLPPFTLRRVRRGFRGCRGYRVGDLGA